MKKLIIILSAVLMITACSKQIKQPAQPEQQAAAKPPTRTEMMKTITEKEKALPQSTDKRKNNNRVTAGLVNGGLSPISGEGSVGHGDTYDTVRATLFHWGFKRFVVPSVEALWHSVWASHQDVNTPYPGRSTGLDMVNYYETFPNPAAPHVYEVLWPHGGLAVTYFIGVSSDGGWNYAGKTIPNN